MKSNQDQSLKKSHKMKFADFGDILRFWFRQKLFYQLLQIASKARIL